MSEIDPMDQGQAVQPWSIQRVGVVGMGLIGGSIALDLSQQGVEVQGLVHREVTAERARSRGLAPLVSTDPSCLQDCDLVILALPLALLRERLKQGLILVFQDFFVAVLGCQHLSLRRIQWRLS